MKTQEKQSQRRYVKEDITNCKLILSKLPAPTKSYSALEAVKQLASTITMMRKNGHSDAQIRAAMRDGGIDVSQATFRNALNEKRRKRAPRAKKSQEEKKSRAPANEGANETVEILKAKLRGNQNC